MVLNTIFNNISAISWRSGLLWRKPGYPNKTTDLPQVTDKIYLAMLYRVHLAGAGFKLTTSVVIGTDCIVRSKSIYHTIMTTPKVKITGCTNKIRLYIYMCIFQNKIGTFKFATRLMSNSNFNQHRNFRIIK